jgi:hypothetical protein
VTTASVSCTSQYTVGGTLTGLNGTVVLQDNGGNNLTLTANGPFAFTTALVSGAAYAVTVLTQPTRQTCVVSSGSGRVASAKVTSVSVNCTYTSSNATLNGVYNGLVYSTNTVPITISTTATLSNGNSTINTTEINSNGNVVTKGMLYAQQTYSVSTEGALTITPTANHSPFGGVLGADGDAFIWVDLVPNAASALNVYVKAGNGVTQASLAGNYTVARLSVRASSAEADLEKLTVDSRGNYQESATQNISGGITTGSDSGTVIVSTSGVLTLDGGNSFGAIGAGEDLLVFQDVQSGHTPVASFGVKQGTGVTLATLSGSYTIVSYNSNLNGGPGGTVGDLTTIVMDGHGNFSGSVVQNNSGTIANTTTSGTYTVQADGTLTVVDAQGHTSNGAVSADGNALVMAAVASGATPKVFIGLRQ